MFTFHKPKVFRSTNGCCICKAKSSSSRFTDSKKYEGVFVKCFDLDELRTGEICNACVLLVKRFLKLPADSKRNWNHVVDARSGPGIKSLVKSKNKSKVKAAAAQLEEELLESPEKIVKKKHVYKRKKSVAMPVRRQRNPSIAVSDFLDMTFWKREKVCCGTIFRGPFGEVAIDARYYTPCFSCKVDKSDGSSSSAENKVPDNSDIITTDTEEDDSFLMDDEDEYESAHLAAARKLSSVAAAASASASASPVASVATVGDVEDEGFFDKPAASPLSSGGGSNTEDLEDFVRMDVRTTRSISTRFGDGT